MLFCHFLENWNHPDIAEQWDNSCSFLPFPEPWPITMSDWGDTRIHILYWWWGTCDDIFHNVINLHLPFQDKFMGVYGEDLKCPPNNHLFYTCFHSSLTPNKDTVPPFSIQYSIAVGHYATKIKQIEEKTQQILYDITYMWIVKKYNRLVN